MSQWVINGIRKGIKTTAYPSRSDGAAGVTPGLPRGGAMEAATGAEVVADCPTQALSQTNGAVSVDYGRCVHCYRCLRYVERPLDWERTYEWAAVRESRNEFSSAFKRSIHVIVVDAGDCGACLNEVKQLNNPYYNMHRLGFFITPTPRHADVMLVVGPVTDYMRFVLHKVYDAMPTPKWVIAVGACAVSGGIFAGSFVCAKGLRSVLPVDVEVPGQPPPPLAILHGLLVAVGRKNPASQVSHLLGMIISDRSNPALLAWVGSLASVLTLWVSGNVLCSGDVLKGELWTIPGLGRLMVSLDRLSALFLLVAGLVVLASSIFSSSYLKRYSGHYSLKALNAWYLLLFASIVLILIANDLLTFLLAWELMSILSYLLVAFEHAREEASRAGYQMLAMGEVGFLAVALALLFLGTKAGSLEFSAMKSEGIGLDAGARWILFLLTFFGFGIKAGLVPFNTWLPRAHPAAPANVSAILSGVILNLGLYGIIRLNLDLVPVNMIGAGVVMLVTGTISALVGILYATIENDLKAMLAHSSIENIGIVTVGLGAGLIFANHGKPGLAGIAFIAAFYHMVNHSVYKALLFLGAGTLDDRTGTRDLNKLGGLIRRMPWTSACFLAGTLSIAALPPFNGFVSEWLTLQTMLRSAELSSTVVKIVFALCGAALALTAALAITCFVKAFAMGFLGMTRSVQAQKSIEASRSMTAPLMLLAVFCLLLGVLPTFTIPVLSRVLQPMSGTNAAEALVPPFFASSRAHAQLPIAFAAEFHDLGAQVGQALVPGEGLVVMHRGGSQNPVVFAMSTSYMLPTLLALLIVVYVAVRVGHAGRRSVARQPCWDGGVRRLLAEMTYTATGFSNPVRVIFEEILRPVAVLETRETVYEHFRTSIRRRREEMHVVERYVAAPLTSGALKIASHLAAMHHGRINDYAGYGLVALIIALVLALTLSTLT